METGNYKGNPMIDTLDSLMQQSPYGREQTARLLIGNMVSIAKREGMSDKEIADTLMSLPPVSGAEPKESRKIPQKGDFSLLASRKSAEEIREDIHLMTTFLACSELMFADAMQRISFRILGLLKEKNLYRHELKKYANKLKEVTDTMMMRSNSTDRSITLKQCGIVSPRGLYGKDFYEEGGGILNRMSLAFHRDFELKFKRIRLDNKWIAEQMGLPHTDLIAEIFTLSALAQCDIELFDEVQKQIDGIGRGRIRSKTVIKSTHGEAMRNAARNLIDRFTPRSAVMPEESVRLMRLHLKEFQQDITGQRQFEFFNGQFLALKMDFIEYYLARLRMDMQAGNVSVTHIRDVWNRMGKKECVQKFFSELKAVRIPKKADLDAMDFAKVVARSKGDQKAMNSFRRLSANGERILPPKESEDEFEMRVLRSVARKFDGQLPDDVLGSMMKAHGTKKAVMQRLMDSGPELLPTLRRVRKMKASELKHI